MRHDQFIVKRVASAGLLFVFLTASVATARDNEDKRDRSNNSGSSGSSSSRSMSSSSSSGQSRSSGNDSSRSLSTRSSQSVQIPSSDRSTRSFGSGSSNSGATTFSGQSYSGFSGRSSDSKSGSQTVARPIDGGGSNDGGNAGSSYSGFGRGNISGGDTSTSGSPDNGSVRRYSGTSGNSAPFNRFSDNSSQSDRSSDYNTKSNSKTGNQNRDGNITNTDSNNVKRAFNGQNNESGKVQFPGNTSDNGKGDSRFGRSQSGQQQNQFDAGRSGSKLTKEKVDDFLQLRRDNSNNALNGSVDRNASGKFNRDGSSMNNGVNQFKSGQLGSQKSFTDSKKDGDQAWVKRFGKSDGTPGNNLQGASDGKSRDVKNNRGSGIVNLNGNNPADDRKFDKALVDRKYQDWRKNASDNKLGTKADHRDWSGQWKSGERLVAADQVRDHWKKNGKGNGKDLPFSKDWWNGHDHHDGHWNHWDHFGDHHYHPYHWWSWCSAPLLTTWVSFGWNEPCYWDYGPGEYIYCNNGIVYVNGTWFEPAPVFYRRTLFLAQQAPVWTPVQAAQIDWLPLGVFVISRDGVADNNVLVQLAVTKDGVIGGTMFNQLTGVTFPIQGMVDKQTQRAAWTYTDDQGAQIVMESSIFNLTQPAATGLIHYSPDNIQVIELVRLEDPNAVN